MEATGGLNHDVQPAEAGGGTIRHGTDFRHPEDRKTLRTPNRESLNRWGGFNMLQAWRSPRCLQTASYMLGVMPLPVSGAEVGMSIEEKGLWEDIKGSIHLGMTAGYVLIRLHYYR